MQRCDAVEAHAPGGIGCKPLPLKFAQTSHQRRTRGDVLAGSQLVEHVQQRLVGVLGMGEELRIGRQAALLHCTVQVQQGFAHLIDLPQIGRMGGMGKLGHVIEQCLQGSPLSRLPLPVCQQRLGVQQTIHGLRQESCDLLWVAGVAGRGMGIAALSGDARVDGQLDLLDQLVRTRQWLERGGG